MAQKALIMRERGESNRLWLMGGASAETWVEETVMAQTARQQMVGDTEPQPRSW